MSFRQSFSRNLLSRSTSIKNSSKIDQLISMLSFRIRQPYKDNDGEKSLVHYAKLGIIFTLVISLVIAYFFESVVELWYTIGSICIPGLILLVVSSYYQKLRVSNNIALFEIIIGITSSIIWLFMRQYFSHNEFLSQLEPMIIGLVLAILTHLYGLKIKYSN